MERHLIRTGVLRCCAFAAGIGLHGPHPAVAQNNAQEQMEVIQAPSRPTTQRDTQRPAAQSSAAPVLQKSPSELGIPPSAIRDGIYGAAMEMVMGSTPVTLVVLGEGTTTLYLADGGEISGGGLDSAVRKASADFLSAARTMKAQFRTARGPASNDGKTVSFSLLTTNGVMRVEAPLQQLSAQKGPLAPLFTRGQNVVTELRKVSERPPQKMASGSVKQTYPVPTR